MTERTCSVDGCGKPHYGRGWCKAHHQRWRRTGDPVGSLRAPQPDGCSVEGCKRGGRLRRGLCHLHYDRWLAHGDPPGAGSSPEERFWARVDKNGPVPECRSDLGPCWLWQGWRASNGYGRLGYSGRRVAAHRLSYELAVGSIPEGLQLDHLCRNPPCCNPAHLEPVTGRVNLLRGETFQAANAAKIRCPAGHLYDEANTYLYNGGRRCKACEKVKRQTPEGRARQAAYQKASRARRKARKNAVAT